MRPSRRLHRCPHRPPVRHSICPGHPTPQRTCTCAPCPPARADGPAWPAWPARTATTACAGQPVHRRNVNCDLAGCSTCANDEMQNSPASARASPCHCAPVPVCLDCRQGPVEPPGHPDRPGPQGQPAQVNGCTAEMNKVAKHGAASTPTSTPRPRSGHACPSAHLFHRSLLLCALRCSCACSLLLRLLLCHQQHDASRLQPCQSYDCGCLPVLLTMFLDHHSSPRGLRLPTSLSC